MSLEQYLKEINFYPILTGGEERVLASRIQQGDEEALDMLVRSNLRVVVAVANRYRGRRLSLSDLIDEGNVGLIRAAHAFSGTEGMRFGEYAEWYIHEAIVNGLRGPGGGPRPA